MSLLSQMPRLARWTSVFAKRLWEGIRRGEITCMRPRVRVGGRYRMGEGEIVVDSIERLGSRTLLRSWRASRDFCVCWTCSKWRNTDAATIFT